MDALGASNPLAAVSDLAARTGREDLVRRIAAERAGVGGLRALTVVVAAEMCSGKSTLVNALAGWPGLLPVDVDVATGVYTVVTYAPAARVRVHTRDSGVPIESSVDEIADWVSVARNPDNGKEVMHVEVGVPSSLLDEGVQFIDTPGVGGLDSQHGAMTLTAISRADVLLFVLDASAPLSRPELRFLMQAAQSIQTVVLALTKIDLNPGWRTVLDEDRRLLEEHAPRFATHRIFPVRAPDAVRAERKRQLGDVSAAERLTERSGLPALVHHLRTSVIQRADDIRVSNTYRLGLSVLAEVDEGLSVQEETLRGDRAPLEHLKQRRTELAELQATTNGWPQRVHASFDDLHRHLTHLLQDAGAALRAHYEDEIALRWRPHRQVAFSAEVEMSLRRTAAELQTALADGILHTAADAARRLGVDDVPAPEARFALPERETMSARPVETASSRQSRALGALILSEAAQTLRSILTSGGSPLALLLAPIGFGSALLGVLNFKSQRTEMEQAEARRLWQEYDARFRHDAGIAINDAIRTAKEETVAALQRHISVRLHTVHEQVRMLTAQAAEVTEREASRARIAQERRGIVELQNECRRCLQELALRRPAKPRAGPGSGDEPSPPLSAVGSGGVRDRTDDHGW